MKSKHLAVLAAAASALTPLPAAAQDIFGFGDSLLDTSRVCRFGGFPGSLTFGTCSNGRGVLQFLPDFTAYTLDGADNYAVGGATSTGTNNQIEQFINTGDRFDADDLVVMSGTSNNVFLLGSVAPEALAQAALADVDHGVSRLVGAGARNIVFFGGSRSENLGSVSPGILSAYTSPEAIAYSNAFDGALPAELAAYAAPGTRVRIFDFRAVYVRAILDPAAYGLTATGACVTDIACVTAPLDVQNQRFLYDIHPTQGGHEILARYIASLIGSADAIPAQADVAGDASGNFIGALVRRLESQRGYVAEGDDTNADRGRLALFGGVSYARSERDAWAGLAGAATAFSADQDAFDIGLSYRLSDIAAIGGAIGYTDSSGDLADGGSIDVNSLHAGAFASFNWPDYFLDLAAGYSRHDLSMRRPGVAEDLAASPEGDTLSGSLQAGAWLAKLGGVQIAPIVSFDYARTTIYAYSETGDPILTQFVAEQTDETLNAGLGVRARSVFLAGGHTIRPFAAATAHWELLDSERTIVTANTFALDLPIYSVLGDDRQESSYGLVSGGVAVELGPRTDLMLDGGARVFSDDNNYAVRLSLTHSF